MSSSSSSAAAAAHHPHSHSQRYTSSSSTTAGTTTTTGKGDPWHGQEQIARLASRFITHLFACPDYPPAPNAASHTKLPYFVAYAIHRTKLHPSVTFAALALLQRLKARFPSARGSSGHRLFISAYMISSKVMCDDTYSNKSWCIVAQGMFTLREINQMEREMCNYLDWELTVDDPILGEFEEALKRDFGVSRSAYPNYPTSFVSKRAARAESSSSATPMETVGDGTSPIPCFKVSSTTPSCASDGSDATAVPRSSSSSTRSTSQDDTPDTPSPSYSVSPVSSKGAPDTPPRMVPDVHAKIRGIDMSPCFGLSERPHVVVHPLKQRMFAFALPSSW